jgi:hypothetical protein
MTNTLKTANEICAVDDSRKKKKKKKRRKDIRLRQK